MGGRHESAPEEGGEADAVRAGESDSYATSTQLHKVLVSIPMWDTEITSIFCQQALMVFMDPCDNCFSIKNAMNAENSTILKCTYKT